MNNKKSTEHYYGIYRGFVKEYIDPQAELRLVVQVPAVLGTQEVWAQPCIPIGTSAIPEIDQGVWIIFENGDPSFPVWIGTWVCIE